MLKTFKARSSRMRPPLLSKLLILAMALSGLFFAIRFSFFVRHLPEPIGSRMELFLAGAQLTVVLSLLAGLVGLVIGFFAALARFSSLASVRYFSGTYSLVFRGTPLITQILFVYYAVPVLFPFFKLNDFMSALIALSLNVGAYHAESIRAGILAVPRGQIEAARSLGLSYWSTLRWIILPQSLKLIIPSLLNNFIALLKDSSIASAIGLLELTLTGQRISSETFLPVPVLGTVAIIYLVLTCIILLMIRMVRWSLSGKTRLLNNFRSEWEHLSL